ncbi:lysine--tRNA ligase [Candidatus Woesearchaeota archaeon]|nr:lysine--tRNA ligase [Candidatus Woesearchaeota archaeon]
MMNEEKKELFWADQIADKIISRDKFRYADKKIPKFSEYVVKTSASISGVLHIGRLSDSVRGASVYRALNDAGVKAKLIWVAEDMDPLRKIPEGVPESYAKHIGEPVSTVPDPDGCHKSYAEHHTSEYFKVLHEFVFEDMEKYSMQEEYRKGSFREYIKKLMDNLELVKEVQNRHRTNPIKKGWRPWTPICGNCGKIITPQIIMSEDEKIRYVCRDYAFETTTAAGCGHKGEAEPLKDAGKLVWKSEWAAQWAKWKIVSEGAGKEYQVPNSAFWINAEIVEKVLDFPSPEPIFYEHIMVDGVKMSASLGNVIYPRDWLKVASPQLLRYYYNKRLMMTRSFSWKELPQLYDEYDGAAKLYAGKIKNENEREAEHLKRQFEISNRKTADKPLEMTFTHASMLAQTFKEEKSALASLRKTGHYDKEAEKELLERIEKAGNWVKMHAPDEYRFAVVDSVSEEVKGKLSAKQKKALKEFAALLRSKEWRQKQLISETEKIFEGKLKPKEFFEAAYLVLLGREKGPRLIPFVLTLGERAAELFESA